MQRRGKVSLRERVWGGEAGVESLMALVRKREGTVGGWGGRERHRGSYSASPGPAARATADAGLSSPGSICAARTSAAFPAAVSARAFTRAARRDAVTSCSRLAAGRDEQRRRGAPGRRRGALCAAPPRPRVGTVGIALRPSRSAPSKSAPRTLPAAVALWRSLRSPR